VQRCKSWKNKALAEAFKKKVEYEVEVLQLPIPSASLTWGAFRRDYQQDKRLHCKPSTYERDEQSFNHFERLISPGLLCKITPKQIESFLSLRLAEGRTPSTVNIDYNSILAIFNAAVKKGVLRESPCKWIKKLKVPKRSRHALTKEDTSTLEAVAKYHPHPDVYDMLLTFLLTGIRLQELTHLPWAHVDLERRVLRVEAYKGWSPKNSQIREVPIPPTLLERLKTRPQTYEYVFPGKRGGVRDMCAVKWLFIRLFRLAKVKGSVHILRHTFATRHAEAGTPVMVLCRLMGHSDPKITMTYYTLDANNLLTGDLDIFLKTPNQRNIGGLFGHNLSEKPGVDSSILSLGTLLRRRNKDTGSESEG
jgi:integrase